MITKSSGIQPGAADKPTRPFEILSTTQHQLIISTQDGSVLSKESFIPTLGLNTRKIYTKTLPKEKLVLTLQTTEEIEKTYIIIK